MTWGTVTEDHVEVRKVLFITSKACREREVRGENRRKERKGGGGGEARKDETGVGIPRWSIWGPSLGPQDSGLRVLGVSRVWDTDCFKLVIFKAPRPQGEPLTFPLTA